ncbi:unnamed protein product [Amoebophrya sp. A120]|nr:unnamed protein product [Amoebophrya sp. A120]|eukprot:GSA120T00016907001.1
MQTRDQTLHVYNVPARDAKLGEKLRKYQQVRSASFAGFHAEQGLYITTRFADSNQLHYVSSPYGMREQLTFLKEPVKICLTPPPEAIARAGNKDAFLYGIDNGGDEKTQFWLFARATGDAKLLTDGKSSNRSPHFCRQSGALAFSSNARDGKHFDVYLLLENQVLGDVHSSTTGGASANQHKGAPGVVDKYDPEPPKPVLIYQTEEVGYMMVQDFYHEDLLLIRHYNSVSDSKMFLLQKNAETNTWSRTDIGAAVVAGGAAPLSATNSTTTTPATTSSLGAAAAKNPSTTIFSLDDGRFTPNGVGVVFSTDAGVKTEFKQLWYYDILKKKALPVADNIPWDVEDVHISSFGDVLVVYNEDGVSTFYHSVLRDALVAPQAGGPGLSSPFQTKMPLKNPLTKITLQSLQIGVFGSGAFKANTRQFGFSYQQATSPSDVFVVDFQRERNRFFSVKRWTESEIGGLDSSTFVTPHLIRYKSFDGLEIPAFVYYPNKDMIKTGGGGGPRRVKVEVVEPPSDKQEARAESTKNRNYPDEQLSPPPVPPGVPVIIHPHGGPEGQHRPRFASIYQFLCVGLGVCIIDPNVRGSAGFGKTFVTLDNCEKREDSVKDIGALIDWICDSGTSTEEGSSTMTSTAALPATPTSSATGTTSGTTLNTSLSKKESSLQKSTNNSRARRSIFQFDPQRIGVWGGSYGGYMVLASLIHFNDKLCCGIDMVGISNFVTFLENTASYRRELRRKKYGDETDPDMRQLLLDISPLTNCQKIKAPLFIAQGKNDPRVPASEAEQIFNQVRRNNGRDAVWYMLADDEGHGFSKKKNVDAYQEAMVQFWRKFLFKEDIQVEDGSGSGNTGGLVNYAGGGGFLRRIVDTVCRAC